MSEPARQKAGSVAAIIGRRVPLIGPLLAIAVVWAGPAGSVPTTTESAPPEVLAGTERLENPPALFHEWTAWLDQEIARVVEERPSKWAHDTSSHEAYLKSVAPMRSRFAALLGIPAARFGSDPPKEIVRLGEKPMDMEVFDNDWTTIRLPVAPEAIGENVLSEWNFVSDSDPDAFSGLSIDDVEVTVP